ncbi:hypothetical protein ACHAXS_010779 [Conticribra weissflogii]
MIALFRAESTAHRAYNKIGGINARIAGSKSFYINGNNFSSDTSRRKNDDDEPWWALSSLHKRVATVLVTSLPDTYRKVLHQSIAENLEKTYSPKSHSINEAIVSARAREASLQHKLEIKKHVTNDDASSDQWMEKQQQLEKEIEKRALEKAQKRVQLELKAMEERWKWKEEERRKKEEVERHREIAFQKWKENVEIERQKESAKAKNESGDGHLDQLEPIHPPSRVDAAKSISHQNHHPVLGPQLACLTYKRIHLTSASTLASLPVYEKQRAYRHDRAQNMAKDKKKTLWMGIPGVISLMEEEDGRLSILDGQHRVGMMALLEEEQKKVKSKLNDGELGDDPDSSIRELANLDLNKILVEVFPHRPKGESVMDSMDEKHPEQDDKAIIFTEINKAEPIKLLDLPGVANKRTRDIIDHAASHFYNTYSVMFSASQKCRAPHLNLDNLRDALFASDVIKREKIESGAKLVKWMEFKNEELRERFAKIDGEGELDSGRRVNETALKKAKKFDFYLGLESTWLYK